MKPHQLIATPCHLLRQHWIKAIAAFLGRDKAFEAYYSANVWADPESRSGPGSRRDSDSVLTALQVLSMVSKQYEIRSIADIPCGDFNWISQYLAAFPDVDYIGYDIVTKLVRRNQATFPDRKFDRLDIVVDIPTKSDLIFCKDLFNHLYSQEVIAAVENMRSSGSTYLLASNNFGAANTELIRSLVSTSRPLDLTAAPYRYPMPIWHSDYLGLWRLDGMRK